MLWDHSINMPRLVSCFSLIVTLLVSPWGMAEEDLVLKRAIELLKERTQDETKTAA